MRAGTLLLAFNASIILGTVDIVHKRHADHLKPGVLAEVGRPDATRTIELSDAVLSHGLRPAQASTDEELGARLIDSRSLERRRGRAGRAGRAKKTTKTKQKKQKKQKTNKKPKKPMTKKKPVKACPMKNTKRKGKNAKAEVGARDLDFAFSDTDSLIGRATTRAQAKDACEKPKCRAGIRSLGEDPCDKYKNHPKFVPCAKPSKFTLEYFQKQASKKPRADKCLFYTNGLSLRAQTFGKKNGLMTIWDIWGGPRSPFMKWEPYQPDNPMRCIIADDLPKKSGNRNPNRQKYFSTMSEAMASMCSGKVTFMDRNLKKGTYARVKQAGIWGKTEFPRWPDWWVKGQETWPNEATKPEGIKDR
ncbi:hypothetical protein PSPO01_02415 [Paraphaeosphaeria sporulosa]